MRPETPDTPETQSFSESTSTKDVPSQNVENIPSRSPSFRRPSKRVRQNDKIVDMLESRRIERQGIIKALTEDKGDDATDLFFKSIANSVKKLRPDLINEAKMKCLQMIIDLENRNSTVFNYHTDHSGPLSNYSSYLSLTPSPVDNTIIASTDHPREFNNSTDCLHFATY